MEGIPGGIPSINAAQNLDAFPLTTHNTSAILVLLMGQQPAFCYSSNSLAFLSQCLTWRAGRGAMMKMNKLTRTPVGADLSRTRPIDRP